MSERAEAGRTVIGRLRLRGTDLDPLSAKLRMESLLSGAHLSPVGLPPSATVCIRRLVDPKPGTLPVRQLAPRPPPAWEEAMAAALRAQLSRAARPAHGPVPPSAEAVLFLDTAELLACLASDVWRGTAAVHWWWQGLFPSGDLARRMVAEWLRRPEYVPAALDTIARRREARPVLSLFTGDEARTLLARVSVTHGLTAVAVALGTMSDGGEASEAPGNSRVAGPRREEPAATGAVLPAPWAPWVPEAGEPGLSREHQALLGVAVMLRRAPNEVRRPDFGPALVAWRLSEEQPEVAPDAPVGRRSPPSVVEAGMAVPGPGAPPEGPRAQGAGVGVERTFIPREPALQAAPVPEPTVMPGMPAPRVGAAGPAGILESAAPIAPPAGLEPFMPALPGASDFGASSGTAPGVGTPVPPPEPPPPAPPPPPVMPASFTRLPEPPPGRSWGLPISTGLGGLFYLVNLALFLELYGDFSQPLFPNLPLPVWDFVTLLGRKLLVDPRPADPVWKVLALLSGRKAGDAPGQDFVPPEDWCVPAPWLRAFRTAEAQVWTWGTVGGRLRVRHPSGFLVLDVPVPEGGHSRAHVEQAVVAATADYGSAQGFTLVRSEDFGPPDSLTPPLERWLGWLVPYVRARLALALGVAPDDPAALERTLFAQEARLHVTETHVDVVLSLAQLPLEVRVAGLDRDVGWLPSAGRHLTFHFE